MLTVCVEAGLGFDAALGRVARNQTGPMAEECARVLQEMQFGKSRVRGAAGDWSSAPTSAELRTFASAIVQSSELGISIGDVLREQSKQMRVQRRQRAEEKAQKLQVKLLLPLISCLLPAMFIVVLGPAVIQLAHFFKASCRREERRDRPGDRDHPVLSCSSSRPSRTAVIRACARLRASSFSYSRAT